MFNLGVIYRPEVGPNILPVSKCSVIWRSQLLSGADYPSSVLSTAAIVCCEAHVFLVSLQLAASVHAFCLPTHTHYWHCPGEPPVERFHAAGCGVHEHYLHFRLILSMIIDLLSIMLCEWSISFVLDRTYLVLHLSLVVKELTGFVLLMLYHSPIL